MKRVNAIERLDSKLDSSPVVGPVTAGSLKEFLLNGW